MHGLIFSELRKYVDAKLGPGGWKKLTEAAGLSNKIYLSSQVYPDADVISLVTTASGATGIPAAALLEDFGEFIAPDLIGMFGSLLNTSWRTVDVIDHTEETIHKVVRTGHPGAQPPELKTLRSGPDEVTVVYSSKRKLCAIAKGICNGLARHFGEEISINETSCMLQGAESCQITVRKIA